METVQKSLKGTGTTVKKGAKVVSGAVVGACSTSVNFARNNTTLIAVPAAGLGASYLYYLYAQWKKKKLRELKETEEVELESKAKEVGMRRSSSLPNLTEAEKSEIFVGRTLDRQKSGDTKLDFFSATKFVGSLDEEDCQLLFEKMEWVHYKKGSVIFNEGDASDDGMYVLVEGRAAVFKTEDDSPSLQYRMALGDSIGDFDLFDKRPREISCRALSDVQMVRITHELFGSLIEERPHCLFNFIRNDVGRLWRVAQFMMEFLSIPVEHPSDILDLSRFGEEVTTFFAESDHVERKKYLAGDVVYSEGLMADCMYILVDGRAVSTSKNTAINSGEFAGPCVIGGSSFLGRTERRETVRTIQKSTMVAITLPEFDVLLNQFPHIFSKIAMEVATFLTPVVRQFVNLGLKRVWLHAGDNAYQQDSEANAAFVVISGRMRGLGKDGEGLWEAGRGDIIGENAWFSNDPYKNACVAVRDTELVCVSKHSFEKLCLKNPRIAMRLSQMMAQRLESAVGSKITSSRGFMSNLATIAILPANPASDTETFACELVRALGRIGPTLHLDRHRITEIHGEDSFGKLAELFTRSKVTSWMAMKEEDYQFIVLEGTADKSPWTQVCVSQADCILIAGAQSTSPFMMDHERALLWSSGGENGLPSRKELVILHPDVEASPKTLPRGTSVWLAGRKVERHHHVRDSSEFDINRLARHLAGREVGLVLGGGGARGLAHLGVIRALEKHGIPIDLIGGTSQGAFMGAVYAENLDAKRMVPQVHHLARRVGSIWELLKDLTLPVLSYFNGSGWNEMVRTILGERNIEDLWIPYFAISTNITSTQMNVHKSGKLWKYCSASMTVADLLPPVYDEGSLLVDGGYSDNLPVDAMKKLGVETIIAVDVENKDNSALEGVVPYDGVSGWWLLWKKINPFAKPEKLPTYKDIMSTLTFMSHTRGIPQNQHLIDLYIRPPVQNFQLLDYDRMVEIVDAGYKYSSGMLEHWQRQRSDSGRLKRGGGSFKHVRSHGLLGGLVEAATEHM